MGNDKKPTPSAWLSNPKNSKFIPPIWLSYLTDSTYPCYGFLILQLQNVNSLHGISLDWYLIPFTFFTYLFIYFLEKGRNYVSFIITIVSNITLLLSHTVIFFRYFISLSHGVNKKAPPSAPLLPSLYHVFTRYVYCFTVNTLPTLFCSKQIIAKDNAFSK